MNVRCVTSALQHLSKHFALPALRTTTALAALATLAACAGAPAPQPEPEIRNARVAPAEAPLQYGDCVEARRRLDASPEMNVDRVPEPLAMRPAPFQKVPAKAWNKDGSAVVKVEVMVDTLGRPEMSTFRTVEVSNAWFAQNLRAVIPRWKFEPASLAGCKVRRVYRFSATVPSRAERAKAAAAAKKPAAARPAGARKP